MQSPGLGLNIPSGSSVPVVVPIPTYQKKAPDVVATVVLPPSAVPTIVQEPTHRLLEVPTTPGASLLPPPPTLASIPAGSQSIVNPSSAPVVARQPTYKPLGGETTVGVSLLPVFTQSQAIAPVANYINKDTTFWNTENQPINPSNSFSTLYVSSLVAGNASISTLTNSTIITTSINIDGQTLDADSDQLFLNGIPIATTANLSSIQDWSFYDAVSSVRMNNNDIVGAKNIQAQNVQAGGISSILVLSDVVSTNNVNTQVLSSIITNSDVANTSSLAFYDANGYTIGGYKGTFVVMDTGTTNATTIFVAEEMSASSINTDTIYSYDLRLVSSIDATNDGVLTVNSDGSVLFFNGSPVAQQTQISSITDWSLYPSISTIQANNPIYNQSGRLQLYGQGIDIGALGTLPSGSTNTIKIRSGDVELLSDGGGGFNVATGLNLAAGAGFALSGGAGGAITTGLLLAIQAGGALTLSAAGAVSMQAAGACSMAATGPVNIGSIAYTSLETIRIDNSLITKDTSTSDRIRIRDVEEIQGNNTGGGGSGRLDILGNGVSIFVSSSQGIIMNAKNDAGASKPLRLATGGATGTGIGTVIYSMEQDFDPNTQSMIYTSGTNNISNVVAPFNKQTLNTCYNVLSNLTTTNVLNELYDGYSTITYSNTLGNVSIKGITNLTANTINTSNLNLANLSISSIGVSSIVGNVGNFSTLQTISQTASSIQVSSIFGTYGEFSTLRTSADNIALGHSAGLISQGGNAIAIGTFAGYNTAGSNSIAIGNSAGYSFTGRDSVMIGTSAVTANNNTIVLNATGGLLDGATANSCYIAPIRQTADAQGYQTSMLRWNSTTKEVSYAPLIASLQVVATSGTAIDLLPTLYGKTYVLTGTTTQAFTTTSLTANDSGWYCIVHNGNATNGGDINLTGMTGTAIIHEQKSTQNGGNVYLYWNGTTLTGY